MASRWLTAAGVQHTPLTVDQLTPESLASAQILILPVDRVRTSAMAQAVIGFARRGGSVIAIYWGPVVREGAEATQACYALSEILGARPTGWRGTGPIAVRPEANAPRAEAVGAEVAVPRGILVTLQPSADARVLARWTPPGAPPAPTPGDTSPTAVQNAVVLRAGTVIYTGLNLFAPTNDTAAVRQLFFWLLEQVTPNLAFEQAREKSSAVMAAVIRTDQQVGEVQAQLPSVNFTPVRHLLDQARDAAAQARQRVSQERYREAGVAVEQARALLQQATQLLTKLKSRSP